MSYETRRHGVLWGTVIAVAVLVVVVLGLHALHVGWGDMPFVGHH